MIVISELDEIIKILEAEIPANPNTPKNQRFAKELERELAKYFKALADAFPYAGIERLYRIHVREGLGSETEGILDPLLSAFRVLVTQRLTNQLLAVWISGSAEMVSWGKTMGGIPITYEGPPIQGAIDWASSEGARLVTRMDEETKTRLAQIISDGIENKRGIPGLARDIRTEFADMSKYRSELIAKTETKQALFNASHDAMVDMGIDGKEWILGSGGITGNCPNCQNNARAGVMPVNEDFPTPENDIHPGCTCAIAPARLNK